jgi:hypothetical protein
VRGDGLSLPRFDYTRDKSKLAFTARVRWTPISRERGDVMSFLQLQLLDVVLFFTAVQENLSIYNEDRCATPSSFGAAWSRNSGSGWGPFFSMVISNRTTNESASSLTFNASWFENYRHPQDGYESCLTIPSILNIVSLLIKYAALESCLYILQGSILFRIGGSSAK